MTDLTEEECINWAGHEARAVSPEARQYMKSFLKTLPAGVPRPSVRTNSNGCFTADWYRRDTDDYVSVSIMGDGQLYYSVLVGNFSKFGWEPYIGGFPDSIADHVRLLYSEPDMTEAV